jgi:hypothetical protein
MLQSSTTLLPDLKDTTMPETSTELFVLPIIFTLKIHKTCLLSTGLNLRPICARYQGPLQLKGFPVSSVLEQGHAIYCDDEVDVKVVYISWVLLWNVNVQEINILRNTVDVLSGLYSSHRLTNRNDTSKSAESDNGDIDFGKNWSLLMHKPRQKMEWWCATLTQHQH